MESRHCKNRNYSPSLFSASDSEWVYSISVFSRNREQGERHGNFPVEQTDCQRENSSTFVHSLTHHEWWTTMGGIPDVGAQKWTPVLKNDPRRRVNASPGWYGRIRASSVPWQPWQRGRVTEAWTSLASLYPGSLCAVAARSSAFPKVWRAVTVAFFVLEACTCSQPASCLLQGMFKIQEGNSQQTTRVILIRVWRTSFRLVALEGQRFQIVLLQLHSSLRVTKL